MGKKNKLATNAILNCLRVCANIIIPLISFPYLTRVLHVENFGKVSRCSNILTYFTLIAGLGINNYAIREGARVRGDREKLSEFSDEIFSIHLISTILTYLLLAVYLLLWKADKDYKDIVMILSVSIISSTIGFGWLPNVMEDFGYITARVLAIHSLSVIAIFLLVKTQEDYYMYAWITGATSLMSGLVNWHYARKRISIRIATKFDWKRHLKPIIVLFANTLMITIYLQSDITMIGAMRGDYEVGLYKTSVQIYSAIKTMLNAVTAVAIPRLIKLLADKKENEYNHLASTIISSLTFICVPAMIGLFLISENCILFVGGREYIESAASLKILCFALIAAVFGNFFSSAILIVNRQENKAFRATVISAFINIALNVFIIPRAGFVGAAITTLIAEIIVAVMLYYNSREYVKICFNHKLVVPMLIGIVFIIGVCYVIDIFELGLVMDTVLKIGLSVAAYGAITLFCRKKVGLQLL